MNLFSKLWFFLAGKTDLNHFMEFWRIDSILWNWSSIALGCCYHFWMTGFILLLHRLKQTVTWFYTSVTQIKTNHHQHSSWLLCEVWQWCLRFWHLIWCFETSSASALHEYTSGDPNVTDLSWKCILMPYCYCGKVLIFFDHMLWLLTGFVTFLSMFEILQIYSIVKKFPHQVKII